MKNELIENIEKIHTTELGLIRIKKNLSLDIDDVVEWCKSKIIDDSATIEKRGKNMIIDFIGIEMIQLLKYGFRL